MDGTSAPGRTPGLPLSIWVLAWASLADQLLALLFHGTKGTNAVSYLLSMLLGALVLGWFAAGVTRARTVRLVIVWVVLGLTALFGTLGLVTSESVAIADVLSLALTFASLGALWTFHRTEWFAWQRTTPATDQGPSIRPVVGVAVAVGLLGGIIPLQHATGVHLDIGGTSDTSGDWDDDPTFDDFGDGSDDWE